MLCMKEVFVVEGGPLYKPFLQGEFFQLYGNDEFLMTCSSSVYDEALAATDPAGSRTTKRVIEWAIGRQR